MLPDVRYPFHLHWSIEKSVSTVDFSRVIMAHVRTVTLMMPPFNFAVATSQAIIPKTNPEIAPMMQPHLFAFFHVTHNAIGTTAEPRMTPILGTQLIC